MNHPPIYVSGPSITQKEIDYVTDAAKNAWYSKANMYNEKFEKSFADYIGAAYAIALPSCTSAIHLALVAAGIGKGDEVIVPDITWIASAAPISYVGASPIFVDIDPDSWCISPDAFEHSITSRTKAVIPVNLYGNIPEMDEIRRIASEKDIFVLEDAAESIGSEYKGRKAGSLGDVGVFSFHGSKTMTTGEGGMLVTDNEEIYMKCLALRDHGRSNTGRMFWNDTVAYKYKMSSLQAALGLAQLERIDELVEKKRQIFGWYKQSLEGIKGIQLNYEAEHIKNTYWMVTVILDHSLGLSKEQIIEFMKEDNISTRPFFYPLSSLPAYAHLDTAQSARKKNIISYKLSSLGINLPCGMDMTEEKVMRVARKLISIIKTKTNNI
jgi:Predicted pyridoxal phosphate-dependent enzyme apparently involved in regulation of cell wall biogenesis